ncbi:MAG: TonB-dependent receptor plug domain-containing protein [Bacteroidales bacterium]|nr:TonB-dependent receptor plug domain-containing protein [Bacteroidales bacterium]
MRLTALIAAILSASGVYAQEAVLRESHITAVRSVIAPTDTISGSRLRSATDAADAIRSFTGLQVKDYGGVGGLKTINVRSLGSEHVGVFIDGIRIDNAQNMQVDLGRFSTDNLSSIELYGGQKSAILQSAVEYGSATAVHLISDTPARNAATVRVRGGSFGTLSPSFRIDRIFRQHLYVTFDAALTYSDGRYRFHDNYPGHDTVMVRTNTDIRSARAEARMGRKTWHLHAYAYDSERGLPGPVVRRASALPLSLDRQSDRNLFLQGSWRHTFTSAWDIALKGKLTRDYIRYRTDPEHDPQSMPIDVYYRQHQAYTSIATSIRLTPFWQAAIASDIQYNTLNSNARDFTLPRRLTAFSAISTSISKGPLNASASLLHTIAADLFRNTSAGAWTRTNTTRRAFTPSLMASYTSNSFTINAFVKRSYRLPSFNDLYYTIVGNSLLSPEKATQYNISARFHTNINANTAVTARLEAYHNRMRDKIVAVPTVNQFRWSMYNIGRADINGAEAQFSVRHDDTKGIDIRYTYQQALDHSNKKSLTYGGQIAYIPLHSGSVNADITLHGWRLDITTVLTSERWSNSANIKDYRIAPWWTLDARISRTIGRITLRADLKNIFNKQYCVVQGYPMPGFNILGYLGYDF